MSLSIIEVYEMFPNQEACIKHIEKARWDGIPVCPYCKSDKSTPRKTELAGQSTNRYQCHSCNAAYSVLVGTMFEATKMKLQKWFLMISIMLDAQKSISARQMARHLKINKDTAHKNMMKIRVAMVSDMKMLKGIVEIDSTWLGPDGSKMNKKAKSQYEKLTRKENKTGIMGLKERGGKFLFAFIKAESKEHMVPLIKSMVSPDATVYTDAARGTLGLKHEFAHHEILNHQNKEYARGSVHTNTIEGFWSLFKRGLVGQWHKISDHWTMHYLAEFAFRNENKTNLDTFGTLVGRMLAK